MKTDYALVFLDGPKKGETMRAKEYRPYLWLNYPLEMTVKTKEDLFSLGQVPEHIKYYAVMVVPEYVTLYSINPNFFKNEKA